MERQLTVSEKRRGCKHETRRRGATEKKDKKENAHIFCEFGRLNSQTVILFFNKIARKSSLAPCLKMPLNGNHGALRRSKRIDNNESHSEGMFLDLRRS